MARNYSSTPSPEEIDIALNVANLALDTTDLWIEAFGKAFADENIWYLFNLFFSFDNKKRFSVNYVSDALRKRFEIHEEKMQDLFNRCLENRYLLSDPEESGIYRLSDYFSTRKEVYFRKSSTELLILYGRLTNREIETQPLPTGHDYSKTVTDFWVHFEGLWRDALAKMLNMKSFDNAVVHQYLPKAMEATAWYTVMLVWSRDHEIKTGHRDDYICIDEIEKRLLDNFNCEKSKVNDVIEFLKKIEIIKSIKDSKNRETEIYSMDLDIRHNCTFVFVDLSKILEETNNELMKICGNKLIEVDFKNKVRSKKR